MFDSIVRHIIAALLEAINELVLSAHDSVTKSEPKT